MRDEAVVSNTKWAIVLYSLVVFACTVFPPAGIVELTSFSGAVFAASFFPSIFGGLYLKWATGHGAFWSMLIGMVSCVGWRFLFRFEYESLRDVHEIIPSFLLSFVAFVVISKLTSSKAPDEEHLNLVFG